MSIETTTPPARKGPKFNGNNQYLVETAEGALRGHTRATTVAETMDSRWSLERWQQRMAVAGVALEPHLLTEASSLDPESADDRSAFDELCKRARQRAGADKKATLGTALHRFTEDLDTGRKTVDDIPPQWQDHMRRYRAELDRNGLQVDPLMCELVLIEDRYRVAGSTDRLVTTGDGRRMVFDLKTGNLDYSWLAISVQLAIYAYHTAVWDPVTEQRLPRIDVDLNEAIICHLPVDGDTCELHTVDVHQGWGHYVTSHEVRAARRDAKQLHAPYSPPISVAVANLPPDSDGAWLRRRIEPLLAIPAAAAELVLRWPPELPQWIPDDVDPATMATVDRLLTSIEAAHEMPFAPSPPSTAAATVDPTTGLSQANKQTGDS